MFKVLLVVEFGLTPFPRTLFLRLKKNTYKIKFNINISQNLEFKVSYNMSLYKRLFIINTTIGESLSASLVTIIHRIFP